MSNLLIVESPNKIKTIKKYLGEDWNVVASVGHIRDLPKKDLGIDTQNKYLPSYTPNPDKKDVINSLKSAISRSSNIFLATDQDREGEAIAYHICELLKLDISKTKRVTFNELSKKAITAAISKPRLLDMNLVDAQQSRRVIDRLVGYKISPYLTSELQTENYLSAGRVQSAALKMVVETEKTINTFKPESCFKLKGIFTTEDNDTLMATYVGQFPDEIQARKAVERLFKDIFKITNIDEKERKKQPYPPFTTSTLQQQANKLLNFNLATTTKIAQALYEKGFVTYIRTDSIAISDDAKLMIKDKITNDYSAQHYHERNYKNNIAGAQEAHEAIRPTDFNNDTNELNEQELSLYELIVKRTLASFLPDLSKKVLTLTIENNSEDTFISKSSTTIDPGWTILYQDNTDDEEAEDQTDISKVPELNSALSPFEISAKTSYTKPPERFTEATIVKELEKNGIGRPSTFSSIINILFKRKYIETKNMPGVKHPILTITISKKGLSDANSSLTLGGCKNKLVPTELGVKVIDFLEQKFSYIIDYNFTNQCESSFDDIAIGKNSYFNVVDNFYKPFSKLIESLPELSSPKSNRINLGQHQGKDVEAGKGKYGTYILYNDKFHNVQNKQPSEITLEFAVNHILKKKEDNSILGMYKNKEVKRGKGKYGTYIHYNKKFHSVKNKEPEQITLEEAIEIINGKNENPNFIKKEGQYLLYNGPYGPYIKSGKSFIPIRNVEDPAKLSMTEIKKIIENYKNYKKSKK